MLFSAKIFTGIKSLLEKSVHKYVSEFISVWLPVVNNIPKDPST